MKTSLLSSLVKDIQNSLAESFQLWNDSDARTLLNKQMASFEQSGRKMPKKFRL
jgi:hypothetical protein